MKAIGGAVFTDHAAPAKEPLGSGVLTGNQRTSWGNDTVRPAVLFAILVGTTAPLTAAPALSQTLQETLARTLDANPGVQAAKAQVDAAEARIRQARAAGLPQLGAGATYQVGTGDYDPGPNGRALLGSLPSGPEDSLSLAGQNGSGRISAEAAIEQPIFTGLRIVNGIRGAKAASAAEDARAALVRQRTGLAIADAYTGLVAARARLLAAQAAAERFGTEAGAARVRFDTGRNTRTDLSLAEAQAASADGLLAGAQAEVIAAQAQLTALTGTLPEPLSAAPPPVPATAEEAVAAALADAPALRAARFASEAADAALRVAKGARSPQLSARAAAQYAEDQFVTGDELTALTLTAQLRVPIFEGGAIGARIAEARAEARAARFAADDARRAVEADARAAFARYTAATLAEEAARLRAEAAALAAEGAGLERELGQRNLQDTLAAIALGAEARAAQADAGRARVLAAYALRAAAGQPLVFAE